MSEGSGKQRRPRVSREQRRAQILAAALGCFSAKGYHAATMDDLVRASGLSKGSLYWHFESKQQVFLALFELISSEMFKAWQQAEQAGGSSLDILMRQAALAVDTLSSQRSLLLAWSEFLTHDAGRQRMRQMYTETRRKLAELVSRGVRAGEIRDLPPEQVAAVLTAGVEGMFLQALVDPEFRAEEQLSTLWEVILRGIAR